MRTDDSSNYHTWTENGSTHNGIWNYGKEVWCNLEGRYIHIVADLRHLEGQDYNMELCSVGVMGTQYVREEAIPETLEIQKDDLTSLTISNIYSSMPIGNSLNINLRLSQENEFESVSITEMDG